MKDGFAEKQEIIRITFNHFASQVRAWLYAPRHRNGIKIFSFVLPLLPLSQIKKDEKADTESVFLTHAQQVWVFCWRLTNDSANLTGKT